MKTSILQENLIKALNKTGRIISAKATIPILQNVLINAEPGKLTLSTSNLETTESVSIGAKTEKPGKICVSAKLFTELVSSFPQETIELSVDAGSLKVRCMNFKASLPGVNAEEFPPISKIPAASQSSLEKDKLLGALTKVIFSAATDEGRPLLTGIKFQQKEDELLLAATDGYRLSVKKVGMHVKGALSDAVIPARVLAEVVKIALDEKENNKIIFASIDENQLGIIIGDTEITTRIIGGEYPNFEKIIPSRWTTRALIDKESLLNAVKSAAIFARDNANIVKLVLDKQRLTVSANAPQTGENSIEVEAKIDGEGGEIAFNSRFLIDYLTNSPEEEVLFEMTGSLNSGVFKPVKDDSCLHIIMPVRISA